MIKLARPVFSYMSHLFGYDMGKDVPGMAEKIRQRACGAKLEAFCATTEKNLWVLPGLYRLAGQSRAESGCL